MSEQLVAARYVDGSIDFVEMVMLIAKYGLSLEQTLSWTQSANALVFLSGLSPCIRALHGKPTNRPLALAF